MGLSLIAPRPSHGPNADTGPTHGRVSVLSPASCSRTHAPASTALVYASHRGEKKLLFYFYFVIVKQKFVNGLLITILTISQCFRQLLPAPRPQSCEDDDPFCAQDCQNCGHGHHQGLCAVCVPGH